LGDSEVSPSDPAYAKFWSSPESFSEAKFATNFTSPRGCVDVFWAIIFVLNAIASVVLFVLANPLDPASFAKRGISRADMLYIGLISVGFSAALTLLSSLMMYLCPRQFIKLALWIGFAACLAMAIVLAVFLTPLVLLSLVVLIPGAMFFWCCTCRRAEFSAQVLDSAAIILKSYPTVYAFNIGMYIFQAVLSYLFTCGTVLCYCLQRSPFLYVYIAFSYFWIEQTLSSFTYETCAGVALSWYFLNGTPFMPDHPLLLAFRQNVVGFGQVVLS
jgi:hypothetical protein